MSNVLAHRGTKRFSGRYEWGSGENPYQHENWYNNFLREYATYVEDGLTPDQIAKKMGISRKEVESRRAATLELAYAFDRNRILRLKEHGYSNTAIAEKMGMSEGSVRNVLKNIENDKKSLAMNTADMLKSQLESKQYLDVSKGAELEAGISRGKLDAAISILKEQGYVINTIGVPQVTDPTGQKKTTTMVLSKDGVTKYELYNNLDAIQPITDYCSKDGGTTFQGWQYPESIDSKRIAINYREDGGADYDGVIQIRRGVQDISLGNKNYGQVRIAVDGTHYLKGMAIYSDDLPDGVDILFNTNKSKTTPALGPKNNTVLKPLKDDKQNPFGATLKSVSGQSYYEDKKGSYYLKNGIYTLVDDDTPKDATLYSLSKINFIKEEGDWNKYKKSLPAQFLSKQPKKLIESQLNLAYANKAELYEKYNEVQVPEIRKQLLKNLAGDCDKTAAELRAAALPRQSSKVILPVRSLKDGEVYAPTYKNGEKVALIRYPHQGVFEIPILTVNNNNREGKRVVRSDSIDAIGINSQVANQLSGADFDGDSVTVIPLSSKFKIKAEKPIPELANFDPKLAYPGRDSSGNPIRPGMKFMNSRETQLEMGKITNLITDMSFQKAEQGDIVRAVKHALVVIDAEKHELDYKMSEEVNGIAALKKKYRGSSSAGASTLISRANKEITVNQKHWRQIIDPKTGKDITPDSGKMKQYYKRDSNNNYVLDSKGNKILESKPVLQATKMMYTVDDAFDLSYGTVQETLYANYANKLKALANKSRKEYINIETKPVAKNLKEAYKTEIDSIKAKLDTALANAPKERQAQRVANVQYKEWKSKQDYKTISKEGGRKSQQLITQARADAGADGKNSKIKLNANEWDAIKAGAVSNEIIRKVVSNMRDEDLMELLYPSDANTKISDAMVNRMKAMSSTYTIQEIADEMGISVSTVSKYLKGA